MDQIEQAVKYALDPSADANVRQQAYEFCNQLRDSPEGWQLCLELYRREPKADPTTRHFALQVIEHVLQNADRLLEPAHLMTIREALFACVTRDYHTSTTAAAEPAYVRNKLAHTVALLFLTTYIQHWPSFFADLHGLMYGPVSPGSSSPLGDKGLHPGITDFYLRILLAIDEEMVNPVIHRGAAEVERNTRIKDAMRERDLTNLAATWHDVLVYFQNQPLDIVPMLLRILGVYVSWIDISLVANDRFIPLIYQCLESRAVPNPNATPVRNAACDCLTEIVRKGMKPPDKLALIQYLGVPNVVVRLDVASTDSPQEQDTEFTEHVARLINVTGLELKMVWLETDAATDAHQTAQRLMEQLFPAALYLLADEYDDISTAIFPFLNEMLTLFKKQVRRNQVLSETQQQFVRALAPILLLKMKYDEDSDWDPLDDDEAEALFQEMRKSIQGYLQNLAIIDSSMFMSLLAGIIEKVYGNARQFGFTAQDASPAAATISQPNSYLSGVCSGNLVLSLSDTQQALTVLAAKTMEALQNVVRDGPVSWSQAELGLCLTHLWTVAFPHRGPLVYTTTGNPVGLDAPAEHWTTIGQLLRLMVQSNVVAVNHPLVPLSYFETVVRYYTFFEACPNAVPLVLEAFVDQRGLHHSADRVRCRTYYTFHRFVKLLKKVDIGPYVQTVLNSLQDLLGVQAQAPTMNSTGSADDLATDKAFDSQVYLFETAGSLATYPSLDTNVKVQYLKAMLDPLLSQAQSLVQSGTLTTTADDYSVWQLHHLLMAIGSVAKGVPEASKQGSIPWSAQLVQATEVTLLGLNAGGRFPIVRDASRFAFARLSTCLGLDSLQFLPALIQRLLADCSMPEFTDFLGFMDLI
ncbi:pre-tRNA nuclear export protein, partial [Dimargaris xerosporica]